MTYSPIQSKTQTPGSNNTSLHSEARNTIKDFQTGNTIEYFAKVISINF